MTKRAIASRSPSGCCTRAGARIARQAPTAPRRRRAPRRAAPAGGRRRADVTDVGVARLARRLLAGTVNQREFREHWLPLRGGMMLGAARRCSRARRRDYEYLRIEPRADGVYYVAMPSGNETAFKLASIDHRRQGHASSRSPIPTTNFRSGSSTGAAPKAGCTRRSKARSRARTGRSSIRCAASTARPASSSASSAWPRWKRTPVARARELRADARGGQGRRAAALFARQRVPEGAATRRAPPSTCGARSRWTRTTRRRGSCSAGRWSTAGGRTKRSRRIATASRSRSARATSRPARRWRCSRGGSRRRWPRED